MKQTWRWFGPDDPVPLAHVRQAGASGIVTALHHLNDGRAWPADEVQKRKAEIEAAGLEWSIVESVVVHEDIKTRTGKHRELVENYKASIRTLAAAGIRTICYNFMAITDWTRTDLDFPMPHGGTALRFDIVDFCAYDALVLKRDGAEADHPPERIEAARIRLNAMSESDLARLETNLIGWVPAREFIHDRESFRRALDVYRDMTVEGFRENLFAFLREIVPVAEEAGVKMAIHPDDPPFPIFGLPRVVTCAEDAAAILAAHPSPANGLTLCTGSYGAGRRNDLPAMAEAVCTRHPFRASAQCDEGGGRLVPRGRASRRRHRHGRRGRRADCRGASAQGARTPRLGNPDAARSRPPDRRRHRQEGEPRLFLHRTTEGSCRTARRHARGRGADRRMMPKSGSRFSEKIMLKQKESVHSEPSEWNGLWLKVSRK